MSRSGTVTTSQTLLCSLGCKRISTDIEPASLNQFFAGKNLAAIIGGHLADTVDNRFSYWAAEPVEVFEFNSNDTEPFEKLNRVLNKYKLDSLEIGPLPRGVFPCGWIGYFSYDLGRFIEKVGVTTIDDLGLGLIRLCFYDKVICYDRIEKVFWLIALEIPGQVEPVEQKIEALESDLAEAKDVVADFNTDCELEDIDFSKIRSNMSKKEYLAAIEKTKKYIYDGDVYQINFSQRYDCDYNGSAIDLYQWQNLHNPSPFAAFIQADDFAIVSASPEMFITLQDGMISTKPIKGTRRRLKNVSGADKINAQNFQDLVNCQKEQAELNMIIDLERNDFGRICEYGTIKVVQPRTIEEYPTVYHAVATVKGQVRSEISFCDILKAMFPGGSITGAPKIRAMEIIDELEPTQRSVYTGSIALLGVDSSACLNIAIRTIIIKGQKAFAQTGGGIVADSKGESEYEETITKARAMLAGITASQKKL